jgi:hypothetical protein
VNPRKRKSIKLSEIRQTGCTVQPFYLIERPVNPFTPTNLCGRTSLSAQVTLKYVLFQDVMFARYPGRSGL